MGQTKMSVKKEISNDEKERLMDELVDAISTLAKEQTGALITFERTQSMIDYINTGTKINADIRSELFLTIFWKEHHYMMGQQLFKEIVWLVQRLFIHQRIKN